MIVRATRVPCRTPLAVNALDAWPGDFGSEPVLHVFRVGGPSAEGGSADEAVACAAGGLSDEERERAARFRFDRDRRTFVIARAALRRLLAVCTGIAPSQLAFVHNAFGKPELADMPVRFNVSHTDGAVAIGLWRGGSVGVDIERVAIERAALDAAQRYFSDAERRALQAQAAERRHEFFFALWTLKEAFVKASGEGLSIPLDAFSFAIAPHGDGIQLQTADRGEAFRWRFASGIAFRDWRWSAAFDASQNMPRELRVIEYG